MFSCRNQSFGAPLCRRTIFASAWRAVFARLPSGKCRQAVARMLGRGSGWGGNIAWERSGGEICARWPVSRVLSSGRGPLGWPFIWDARYRTPRATYPGGGAENRLAREEPAAPTWSCSGWGLPCRRRYRSRGALLPHPFTLTRSQASGGLLSVALSLGSPPPGVTRHPVSVEPGLSSPNPRVRGGHPTIWRSARCNGFRCAVQSAWSMSPPSRSVPRAASRSPGRFRR